MEKLSSPPLVYVCARIEFATLPISHIEDTINALHEELRADYPDFQKGEGKQLRVEIQHDDNLLKSEPQIIEENIYRWHLRDKSGSWEIRIDHNSVFVQTGAYEDFPDLKKRLLGALEALNKRMSVNHTRSIGLRYINKVSLDMETERFPEVRDGFLQPNIEYFKAKAGSKLTSMYQSEVGWVQLKTNLLIDSSVIPDELLEAAQRLGLEKQINEVFATVDIDSFNNADEYTDYSLEHLEMELDKLHEAVEETFKAVFTSEAIEKWS